MRALTRTDTSLVGQWWWTIDRWLLASIFIIAVVGMILTLAASPPVADRIGLDSFYFAKRQIIFLTVSVMFMVAVSFFEPRQVRWLAAFLIIGAIGLMIGTLLFGAEIKGAKRWLNVGGLSIQASEFVKPGFAVLSAWFFASRCIDEHFPGHILVGGLFAVIAGLLLLQPDVGMTVVVSGILAVQSFIAGLSWLLVLVIAFLFLGGSIPANVIIKGPNGSWDHIA